MSQLPTLCEVTYERPGLGVDLDLTPFRHRVGAGKFRDRLPWDISGIDPAVAYYETVTLGCRTPLSFMGRPCTVISSYSNPALQGGTASLPAHATLNHSLPPAAGTEDGLQYQGQRERVKTAPVRHSAQSPHGEDEDKLRWIPALDCWVSDKKSHSPAPYTTFVNSMNLLSRGQYSDVDPRGQELPLLPCDRFTSHMAQQEEAARLARLRQQLHNEELQRQREKRLAMLAAKNTSPFLRRGSDRGLSNTNSSTKVRFKKGMSDLSKKRVKEPPPAVDMDINVTDGRMDEEEDLGFEEGADTDEQTSAPATPPPAKTPSPPPRKEPSPPPAKAEANLISGAHKRQPPLKPIKESVPKPSKSHKSKPPPKSKPNRPKRPKPESPRKVHVTKETPRENKRKIAQPTPTKPAPESIVISEPVKNLPPAPPKAETPPASAAAADSKAGLTDLQNRTDSDIKLPARGPLNKKVRWRASKKKSSTEVERKGPEVEGRKTGDWIYGDDDGPPLPELDKSKQKKDYNAEMKIDALPDVELPFKGRTASQRKMSLNLQQQQAVKQKDRWGPRTIDSSYLDEMERQRLAEERRRRAREMFDKLRKHRHGDDEDLGETLQFEDCGFLAKYCIFNRGNMEAFRRAFDAVDEDRIGWLPFEDLFIALRGVNRSLSDVEEEYMYRILQMTGYDVTRGCDFKLFAVMCALSHKIASLDSWMKNLIGRMNFQMLEMKMFMCKTLWECNVDPETNKIPIDQLCVELRAGGVSYEHECEVRDKLGHLIALDLLDFLTYVPLFIMIHESVVENPLNDVRNK